MNRQPTLFLVLLLSGLLGMKVHGQGHPAHLPKRAPAPLLYVRFGGPLAMHVTFYQGSPKGSTFDTPFTVGMRPGYIYRVELTNIPGHPEAALFPTLEVRGTLELPPGIRAAEYPAPVVFSEEDIERILAGTFLTKVIYLEHPEHAIPTATTRGQPLEIEVPPDRDPLAEARSHGRPVLIVRVGLREVSRAELARQSVPGTILLPGEQMLSRAAAPPQIPPPCWQTFDPLLGPRPPEEECLHDGGDAGLPAGFDRDGHLAGVGPADTVAAYADSSGRRRIAISNRVCICVPRYGVTRTEANPSGYETVTGPGDTRAVHRESQVDMRVPPQEKHQNEQLEAFQGRLRPSGTVGNQILEQQGRVQLLRGFEVLTNLEDVIGTAAIQRLRMEERARLSRQIELARQLGRPYGLQGVEQAEAGPSVVGRVEGLKIVGAIQEAHDVTVVCDQVPQVLGKPGQPLFLTKWADVQAAQVGDVVSFTLKYSNTGGKPITDLAVSDSLTTRLEYIPGSAESSRDAVFTTQENEAGSLTLHWEITGRLLPGQSGVVRFKARVR